MTDILRLLLILLLLTVSLGAYFLVIGALFPSRVTRSQRVLNQMTGRSFGVGFVNFFFFGVIAVVLFSIAENTSGFARGLFVLPALVITAVLTVLLSFGLAGVVNELGMRLFPGQAAPKQTLWGSIALTFACALPFVGWFLLLPYVAFLGIGATILGFLQRNE
jgi:hypothetical protein